MIMNKKTFVEVLDYLETDGIIEDFEFFKKNNSIGVWSLGDEEKAVYVFDENENLINPKIQKLQSKINHLEKQKKELENQIKLLTK